MRVQTLITALILLSILLSTSAFAQEASGVEEKLYNFDDMLIDGEFRDPQGMFERARTEAKFEGVLHIERSFMPRIEENAQESTMRP